MLAFITASHNLTIFSNSFAGFGGPRVDIVFYTCLYSVYKDVGSDFLVGVAIIPILNKFPFSSL